MNTRGGVETLSGAGGRVSLAEPTAVDPLAAETIRLPAMTGRIDVDLTRPCWASEGRRPATAAIADEILAAVGRPTPRPGAAASCA